MATTRDASFSNSEDVTMETNNADFPLYQMELDYSHFGRAYDMSGYVVAFLYPTGIILNILCIIIILKLKMHKTAIGYHLLWIAIVDISALIVGISYNPKLQEILNILHVEFFNMLFCKLSAILGYPIARANTWLMTSATFERFLSVSFPLKVKTWPMDKASKVAVGAIVVLVSVEFVTLLVYSHNKCWDDPNFDETFKKVHQITYITSYMITVTLVFVFSAGIVISLRVNKNIFNSVQDTKIRKITLMLFTIAVTFLLSTILDTITFFVLATDFVPFGSQTSVNVSTALFAFMAVQALYHSSNFLIYFIFLENFRNCFLRMFCTCKKFNRLESSVASSAKGDTSSRQNPTQHSSI